MVNNNAAPTRQAATLRQLNVGAHAGRQHHATGGKCPTILQHNVMLANRGNPAARDALNPSLLQLLL